MYVYTIEHSLTLLKLVGGHPWPSKVQNILYFFVIIAASSIVSLTFIQVYMEKVITPEEFAQYFSACSECLHVITKLTMIFKNKQNVIKLLEQMETRFWTIKSTKYYSKTEAYETTKQDLKRTFHIFLAMFIVWIFGSLKLKELPMKCYVPSAIPINVMLILQNVFCLQGLITIFAVDMVIMAMVTLLKMQFLILNESLSEIFSGEIAEEDIKRWVDHHNFLLCYANLINESFSWGMLIYIGNIMLVLCMYMYYLSVINSPGTALIQAVSVISLAIYEFTVCYCIPAQNLMDEIERVAESAYSTEWYEYPRRGKAISMIINWNTRLVSINAGRFAKLSLETCMQVIRTVISYFMFLRTVMGN